MPSKKRKGAKRPPEPQDDPLPSRNPPLDLPPDLPPQVRQIVQAVVSYQGPLPPAAELGRYNEVVPGSASRIIEWAEDERRHRHRIEARESRREAFRVYAGMVFGFLVTLLGLGGAIYLSLLGQAEVAKVLGGLTLAAIVAVFVTGKIMNR